MQVVLALGGIAFQAFLKLLQRQHWSIGRPLPRFGHREEFVFERPAGRSAGPRRIVLLASYHPSRQNTQTGRLTRRMWNGVFQRARSLLDGSTTAPA
jgi:uracil-DNA glycosylase